MLSDDTLSQLLAFRLERNWEQFHTPKNLAIAISVEAGELLEQFQWSTESSLFKVALPAVQDEIADVCILLTYLARDLKIDLDEAVRQKLAKNGERYPIETSRGNARKHGGDTC